MAEANPVRPQLREQQSADNFARYIDSVLAQMQYRSKAAHRSCNQATIFLYGQSGDGKSSTLKYLFDTNIIPANRGDSITRKVTEYRCTVKSSLISEDVLNVCFIDTPGFGDTDGEEADVENLAKISHFIDAHPELGYFEVDPDWVYPNIVLIVISATNDRLSGIYSTFSKMLHVLSKLNVVDKFHPNVVIAVTHAMYLTGDEFDEETKHIEEICRILTRAHFSIEVPVVFIENLAKKKKIEQEGDWHILPDGTRQPLNLFDAMTHLMKHSGDEIGIESVRLLFSVSRKCNIEPIRCTPQNLDLKRSSTQWKKDVNNKFFDMDNAIYSILTKKKNSDNFRIFPLVYNLQKIEHINLLTLKTMDLLAIKYSLYPFQLTDEERDWLVQLLQVSQMKIKLDFRSLGVGYSRQFKDKRKQILIICPLEKRKIGNYVIEVPGYCTAKELRQVTIDIVYDEDAKWFLMKYLKLTFRICYVLFQVEISDIGKFALNDTFVKKLEKSLPEGASTLEYKFENPNFTSFIKDYALHCITGLYFGGCIEGELYFNPQKDEKTSKAFLAERTITLRKQLEIIFGCFQDGIDLNREHFLNEKETIGKLVKCSVRYSGGAKEYHVKSILDINFNKWNSWTNSIENKPICIERMVNSTFIGDILSSSPDEKKLSYAKELKPIKTEKQTGLTDLNFQNSLESISLNDTNSFQSSYAEEPLLTRVQATDRAKPLCSVM